MTIEKIQQKITETVKRCLPNIGDIANNDDLFLNGLNSINVVSLISLLEEEFKIDFPHNQITKKSFESIDSISKLIVRNNV